jgi:hypothetical protein
VVNPYPRRARPLGMLAASRYTGLRGGCGATGKRKGKGARVEPQGDGCRQESRKKCLMSSVGKASGRVAHFPATGRQQLSQVWRSTLLP